MTEEQIYEQGCPFQLPSNWIWGKLEDLVLKPKDDIVDGPFGSNLKSSSYIDSGIPIIRLQNIDRNLFLYKNMKYISQQKAQELRRHNFFKGDVVITKLGAPLGKACVIPDYIDQGIIVADVVRLRVPEELVSKKYLVFAINSEIIATQLKRRTKGTTRPRVNLNHIRKLAIPIAPLNEQHKIVAKVEELFSFLDAGIDSLRKVQAQLKRYRQAVLKYAFEGKMTEEWRKTHKDQKETAQGLLAQITKELNEKEPRENSFRDNLTEAKTLPEKWAWTYLDAITVNHDGKRIPVSREKRESMKGEYPYYGASGVIDSVNNYLFEGDYLLIGEDGANLLARSTPIAFQAKGKFWVNNHAHIITPLGGIPISYLEYYINSIRLEKYVTGTAQPKLTQNAMNKIPVPVAPIKEQLKIIEEISQTFSIIDGVWKTLELMIRYSERLRQSVLNAAFKGNLVSQDPSDEPAEKLLARIKVERTNNNKYGTNKLLEMSSHVK